MTLSSSIILAVLLDHWLGEPEKHHPLVCFGKLADREILTRLFINPSSLRFGLPKYEHQWRKVEQTLKLLNIRP